MRKRYLDRQFVLSQAAAPRLAPRLAPRASPRRRGFRPNLLQILYVVRFEEDDVKQAGGPTGVCGWCECGGGGVCAAFPAASPIDMALGGGSDADVGSSSLKEDTSLDPRIGPPCAIAIGAAEAADSSAATTTAATTGPTAAGPTATVAAAAVATTTVAISTVATSAVTAAAVTASSAGAAGLVASTSAIGSAAGEPGAAVVCSSAARSTGGARPELSTDPLAEFRASSDPASRATSDPASRGAADAAPSACTPLGGLVGGGYTPQSVAER